MTTTTTTVAVTRRVRREMFLESWRRLHDQAFAMRQALSDLRAITPAEEFDKTAGIAEIVGHLEDLRAAIDALRHQ